MSIDIRYPNITATDEKGQLVQMKSYLHQLVEQLNWALQTTEASSSSGSTVQTHSSSSDSESAAITPATFSELKSLIIKSADIVNAYYEEINHRLEGLYVAESEYGTFVEKTEASFKATSTDITEMYSNIQAITSDVSKLIEANAYIKSGLLYEDPNNGSVYGVEVGQKTVINGEEVFNKYARFTANRLSFYDQNDNEVAYISDHKLYIENVCVTSSFQISGLKDIVLADGSVVTKWIG